MAKQDKSWQAPSFMDPPTKRMGWVEECIQEGEQFLKGQTAYQDITKGIDIISGKLDAKASQTRSDLNINHSKSSIRKIVATLADVHQTGTYNSDAKFFKESAEMMNNVVKAVALESKWPRRLRMALQYMAVTSKGYIWPRWTRINGGFGEGRVDFLPLGYPDVLPVQLPSDNDLQGAYAVTICVFMPVWEAHGKFPDSQAELLPVARRRYSSTVSSRRLDLAERFKYGEHGDNWANLYCEIRYTFIHDLSCNESEFEIPMGEQGTSWSYTVPKKGGEVPVAKRPDGSWMTRVALPEDLMIYPQLRLIISSKGMKRPIYDGPAKDWSGIIPLAEYCADDWPWEPGGFSLIHDIYSIERTRQGLERGMDQTNKARLDPTIVYDRNAGLNDATAEKLDPFKTQDRVGVDGDVSKVFRTMLDEDFYVIPSQIPEFIKYLKDAQDGQLGLNEMMNLAEMKANVSSDDALDKILSKVGPLVKDIGAGMEASTVTVWEILKFIIPQYMTTRRVIQYIGVDKISPTVFDYDPEKLIPSHGIDEFIAGLSDEKLLAVKSVYSDVQRAKLFAQNMRIISVPHTMHEITQTQEQMKYLQLWRGGAPIAFADVAKKLNIDNWGEVPGNTGLERYINEQEMMLEVKAKIAALAQSLGPGDAPGGSGPGPKGGQKGTGGRAPSGQQPPKIKQKTGGPSGPRTTVSESG